MYVFAKIRLDTVAEFLLSAGWSRSQDGRWLPPSQLWVGSIDGHDYISMQIHDAIRLQLIVDQLEITV
jgi:hypothetical protein